MSWNKRNNRNNMHGATMKINTYENLYISALGDLYSTDISSHIIEMTQGKSSACERVTFQRLDITSKQCEIEFRHFLCVAVMFAFI